MHKIVVHGEELIYLREKITMSIHILFFGQITANIIVRESEPR